MLQSRRFKAEPVAHRMKGRSVLIAIGLVVLLVAPCAAMSETMASRTSMPQAAALPAPERSLTRIAFGSCLNQAKPQPIWSSISANSPNLMVMLGDNVYGSANSDTIAPLEAAYAAQAQNKEFLAARASLPMLAIWDDHDFGRNDGGGDYPLKAEAARLFEAFWGPVPERPPPFEKKNGGLFRAESYGPLGARIQVVLLDTRYFRSPLRPKSAAFTHWGRYEPDTEAGTAKTMLGDVQWRWLEAVLSEPADLRIIVSSIQVLAEGHGFERWGNLPAERERLLRLIGQTSGRTVIVSGDRHYGAFYELALAPDPPITAAGPAVEPGDRVFMEMTTSAMNMASGKAAEDARMPPLASDIIGVDNFGLAEIDWTARTLKLSLRNVEGSPVLTRDVKF